jgi:hypothetical protein
VFTTRQFYKHGVFFENTTSGKNIKAGSKIPGHFVSQHVPIPASHYCQLAENIAKII